MSYRVTFTRQDKPDHELPGWALNVSRGGLRAILEDPVELGEEFNIQLGDEPLAREGRVVWCQEEQDGVIVGVQFVERLSSAPDGIDLDASIDISAPDLANAMSRSEDELSMMFGGTGGDGEDAERDPADDGDDGEGGP